MPFLKSKFNARRQIMAVFLILLISAILVSCFKQSQLSKVIKSGQITLITRNNPASYFYNHEKAQGFEYELAELFAEFLGVKLNVVIAHNFDDLTTKLNNASEPVFAASGLVDDFRLQNDAKTSQGFMPLQNQVVYHKSYPKPKQLSDLHQAKIKVLKNSHQAYFLHNLKRQYPNLNFVEADYAVTDLLLELDKGEFEVSLVNSTDLAFAQFGYRNVKTAFVAEDKLNLVWATAKSGDNSLIKQMNIFFAQIEANGTLQQISQRYYQHTQSMDYVGIETFSRHLQTRLPLYKNYFKQAAAEHNLDWRLIAAIGYQESQWNPEATSKTGVRGLMMLTNNTAHEMGVIDRLDPKQSIFGGAKYFAQIKSRLTTDILEPHRTWIALAAYNVGVGHVSDARMLAKTEGLDPNEWHNVRMMLLRLKQQQWHSKTKYGYARGGEAVHFAQNVQRYFDILTWYTFQEDSYLNPIY